MATTKKRTNYAKTKVEYAVLEKGEIVKDIEGFPDYYITNHGRVFSTKKLGKPSDSRIDDTDYRIVKHSFNAEKYFYCNIYNENGIRTSTRVHRLVYQYFNPKGEFLKEGFVIDHIDGNKTNNHISNLRQVTQSENLTAYHRRKKQTSNENNN